MIGLGWAGIGDDGSVTDTRTDRNAAQSADSRRERAAEASSSSSWTPLANPRRTRRS